MLRFDLGTHVFPVTTGSVDAQRYFDQGLNWCVGFNQDEALACFKKGLEYDPDCAMLHWGVAYAAGPFYNMPWCDFSPAEAVECTAFCHGSLSRAAALAVGATPLEQALVHALSRRVQRPHPVTQETFDTWDDAFADAMRRVYDDYPENLDVTAFFIEAMMTRTPWKLWDVKTDLPRKGADTLEALDVCERAIALADAKGWDQHPAILHLHIHLLEMSGEPERALDSANRLEPLCPDAGHIHHMPGHIYVLCGTYDKAKTVSENAIIADRKYLEYAGPYNYYTTSRCHDLHLMMYTCMFLGQFEPAMAAANEMCATLTPDVIDLKNKPFIAATMEGYYSMKMHVLVRFGKWQQIIDTSMPSDPVLYCVSTAMHHYAKGVAHAALKNFDEAREERRLFHQAVSRIAPGRKFFNNCAVTTLGVGEKMLDGELQYHLGNYPQAFDHLRESVRRCDDLEYTEPWAWMHPPRHALGALLMEQGHHREAEQVYRADLGLDGSIQRCAHHQENIWALHGLVECLQKRGDTAELPLIEKQLARQRGKTDFAITSSCCCRNMTAA